MPKAFPDGPASISSSSVVSICFSIIGVMSLKHRIPNPEP